MRNGEFFQAVGSSTVGTGEMDVACMVLIVAVAYTVLLVACPIVNLMQQMLFGKEAQGTEDAGAVHVR